MSRMHAGIVVLAAALLGGCANMDLGRFTRVDSEELAEQVDTWVTDRQYGRALEALSRVDPKDPLYERLAQRRRDIKALAEAYEQDILERAGKAVDEGDWATALDLYDQALERLPESTALRDGLARLHKRQSARVEEERLELLIHRGRWLEQTLPIHRRIARVLPRDDDAQQELEAKRAQADEVGRRLGERGAAALADEEYGVAERTLPLAASLTDAKVARDAQARLEAWRARQAQEKEARRKRQLQEAAERKEAKRQRIERLWKAYHQAFEGKTFVKARERLDELAKVTGGANAVAKERTRLNSAVQAEVARLFDEGVSLYSRGEFKEAVARWQRVLELEPAHRPAEESLQRAQRVLERVERLRAGETDESGEGAKAQPAAADGE